MLLCTGGVDHLLHFVVRLGTGNYMGCGESDLGLVQKQIEPVQECSLKKWVEERQILACRYFSRWTRINPVVGPCNWLVVVP